jgi:N-dimethylarginine dimethylaminohydrolase
VYYVTYSKEIGKKISCQNEYAPLKQLILCPPKHMTMSEPVHQDHPHHNSGSINLSLASEQYEYFKKTLIDHHIEILELPTLIHLPEQVFTRDIGFVLGKTFFVVEMRSRYRKGEEVPLRTWLATEDIPYYYLANIDIEGGDVLLDGQTVYVGLSSRTRKNAIQELQKALPDYSIIPIPFHKRYLHLDCVFNVISPQEALIFAEAFTKEEIQILSSRYELIEVPKEEQLDLAANVLSLGNKTVISLISNKSINRQLNQRGFKVIELEFSEMIKAGGSFRCCTLPILRESIVK